jgi:hypothetical protein
MGGQLNRAGLLNLLSATFKPGNVLGTTVLRVARYHRACVIAYVVVLWIGLAVYRTAPIPAADVPLINVYVTCDGADSVGASLCFVVKEAIISSGRYQLVDDGDDKIGIGVHLVSVDTSPPGPASGVSSAVSVTYTFFGGRFEYYDSAQVFSVGSKKITKIASSISSQIATRTAELNS